MPTSFLWLIAGLCAVSAGLALFIGDEVGAVTGWACAAMGWAYAAMKK